MSDIPKIVKTLKGRGTDTQVSNVVKKINDRRLEELDTIMLERYLEQERQRLTKIQGQETLPVNAAHNYLTMMMKQAEVDPVKAKAFLSSLTEEDMKKLAVLSASGQGGTGDIQAYLPLLQGGMNVKDTIAIFQMMHKMVQPSNQNQITLDGIAKIFDSGVKAGGGGGKPSGQEDIYLKFVKPVLDELKETRIALQNKNTAILVDKIERLESRPGFAQEMMMKKEEFAAFTNMFGGGQKASDEIEKMKLEQERHFKQQDLDFRKWQAEYQQTQVAEDRRQAIIDKTIDKLSGPIGRVVEGFGDAGAKRLGAGGKQNQTPNQQVIIQCSCGGSFPAKKGDSEYICPHCNIKIPADRLVPSKAPSSDTATPPAKA